jgi:hypothetical protein
MAGGQRARTKAMRAAAPPSKRRRKIRMEDCRAMDLAACFSADYSTARRRFREAAHRLGAALDSHAIPANGPRGEALSIDVATLGSQRARRAVIVSSALHGVEGFFGAAAQLAWLAQIESAAMRLPDGIKIVLVHAINPYGFAWLRRTNENNVDLNRNFLADRAFLSTGGYRETLVAYERSSSFLNPARPPSRREPYALRAACEVLAAGWLCRQSMPRGERPSVLAAAAIGRLGLSQLQKALIVGQYRYANGLFYGGSQTEAGTKWLQQQLPLWVSGTQIAVHIDFHTGLGTWAGYKLFVPERRGSPHALWAAGQFGDEHVMTLDDGIPYIANGTMAAYFRERNPGSRYHCLTAEFGTYSGIRVLGALRAENQAHFHADRDSAGYRWAKGQLLEALAPAAAGWRNAVLEKALAIIRRAIQACPE